MTISVPASGETRKALERMVALYEGEYDADAPFIRPGWLVAALASEDMQGWLDISTAPRDGTRFLGYGSYKYPEDVRPTDYTEVIEYSGEPNWPWNDRDGNNGPLVYSHWRPLPAPPAPETRS